MIWNKCSNIKINAKLKIKIENNKILEDINNTGVKTDEFKNIRITIVHYSYLTNWKKKNVTNCEKKKIVQNSYVTNGKKNKLRKKIRYKSWLRYKMKMTWQPMIYEDCKSIWLKRHFCKQAGLMSFTTIAYFSIVV